MKGHTEMTPIFEAPTASAAVWKQRLLSVCYLTAVALAMFGWLVALGWAGVAVTDRLFS
jgi:hypothetical protein